MALYSDVPGFENPVCLVGNGEPQPLIDDMMSYLDKMADAVYERQIMTFEPVFADIEQKLSDIAAHDSAHESHPLHKLKEKKRNS